MNIDNNSYIFVGAAVHSICLKKLEYINEAIIVVIKGKIVSVQTNLTNLSDITCQYSIDENNVFKLKKGQFLIPGLIDTHIHAPQYPNIGLGYDLPLLQWLEKYTFPLERKFHDENFAEKVYNAAVKRTLANGTTTACYFATIHKNSSCILASCIKKYGQRAFIGKVNMNRNPSLDYVESSDESVQETKAFIEYVKQLNCPLIKPVITPRFALSCDMNLMKSLAKLASDYQLPIQTHISENKEEVNEVKKQFMNCKNYVDVYKKAGLLCNKTILAHGIYLEPDEISIIKEAGATISHCASSNLLLRSGICPVYSYLKYGIKVSLGTDCSGGNSCSMLDCIRQTMMVSIQAAINKMGEPLSIDEVFYLATLGGAEAMSLESITGNFTKGKDFDAVLVDLNDLDLLEDYNLEQLFQKFIFTGDDRTMKKVFVAGKIVKQL